MANTNLPIKQINRLLSICQKCLYDNGICRKIPLEEIYCDDCKLKLRNKIAKKLLKIKSWKFPALEIKK